MNRFNILQTGKRWNQFMKGMNGVKGLKGNVHLFHYVSCHPVQRWGGDGKTKRAEFRSGMFLVLPLRHNKVMLK